MTLISVHVKGADANAKAGEAYRKTVNNYVADDKRRSAYMVGDFNYEFTTLKEK